jgi:SNF2 family DNA or RNA helicase
MPRVNLLIADDVGLGKTIESGLVALELIIRHRARRVLVVCPASLQVQWRDQMRDKFGLDFRVVDSELMRDLRRRRGIHVNPWSHFPRLITSVDFLKRERPLRLFKETLPAEGESVYPRRSGWGFFGGGRGRPHHPLPHMSRASFLRRADRARIGTIPPFSSPWESGRGKRSG